MRRTALLIATFLLLLSLATAAEGSRRIAITLDDAPTPDGALFSGPQRSAAIVRALKETDAPPVALFVTTSHIRGEAERSRLLGYARAGHLLANHSHAHGRLSRMDGGDWTADLDRARAVLATLPNARPWYRYPFLDEGRGRERRDQGRAALSARGLANGYVTVDTYDWYLANRVAAAVRAGTAVDYAALRRLYLDMLLDGVAFYDAIAVETLGRSPVHVLLLHENDLAALYVGDLVRALRRDGWEVVSPDVAYADPLAGMEPDVLFLGQGRVAALAAAGGRAPATLVHESEDEAWIDAAIIERGILRNAP